MSGVVDVTKLSPIDATREFWKAAEGDDPAPAIDRLLVSAVTRALEGVER